LDATWQGSVHRLFSERARLAPDRLAVVDPHGSWSYGELEARSNQLANFLCASGIQPEDIVAVYGERSGCLVWALLGILKASAAFLILDPAYPASRLIDYLRVAKPRGWLQLDGAGAVPDALEEFLSTLPCPRVLLSRQSGVGAVWTDYPNDEPKVAVDADGLAYVAFTSGSTGKPKGVLGRHGPLSHFLPWLADTFGFRDTDRFSLLSGLASNPLQREVFTPLSLGATLYVPNQEDIAPFRLAEWMQQQRITIAHLTPAMSQILSAASGGFRLGSLRYAFFAGDVLREDDVTAFRNLATGAAVVNFYGATETQRAVGYFVLPPETTKSRNGPRDSIPLGKGIQDVQLLVLNSSGNLAGIGEIGEIYFRSPHLARGYLGDDSLTAERFIPNPFTERSDDRLYKTSELGRYLTDGNVEFVGRGDQQVKIRGFRIELGEIEATLEQHPRLRQAVVVARESIPGEQLLAAYVVVKQKPAPTTTELRGFLKNKLPDHMLPSAFVILPALPLTPSGKVDRRALPPPDAGRPNLATTFVAPRTPAEELLASIWTELLKIDKVGVYDNFFDLGGHSLLAVRVISRIRDAFQVELPLRGLFERPTVAAIAAQIEQIKAPSENTASVLAQLESISDEEAQLILDQESSKTS
jgi:amino acid adenylation domain-containing protein